MKLIYVLSVVIAMLSCVSFLWADAPDLRDEKSLHVYEDVGCDDFVKKVNEHYSLRDRDALTVREVMDALIFHLREVVPLNENNLNVLELVINNKKIPSGTEVNVFNSIKIEGRDQEVPVKIIRMTFGMKGMRQDGVVLRSSEAQARKIFSLYIRLNMNPSA